MQLACTVGDINMWPKRCYVHRFAHLLVWNRTQTIDFDCNFFKYTLALLNALLSVVFFFFLQLFHGIIFVSKDMVIICGKWCVGSWCSIDLDRSR